jgi:agmatine deiminase
MPKPKRRDDGRVLTMTYVNFYVCNGAVIVPMFEDAADDLAQRTIAAAFPDRKLISLDATALLHGGGGIHCITLQQPEPAAVP